MKHCLVTLVALLIMLNIQSFQAAAKGPLPGVTVKLASNKVHHAGVAVMMDFIFTNTTNKPIDIYLDANPSESNEYAVSDGESYSLSGIARTYNFTVDAGDSVKRTLYVDNLPYNKSNFDKIKIVGRSSVKNSSNPYGEFAYTISNVAIPGFKQSNLPKCYFLDTEFDLNIDKVAKDGNDLVVTYTLTNHGKKGKRVSFNSSGKAVDTDGDEYAANDSKRYMSTEIGPEEEMIGKVIIERAANVDLKKVRLQYNVQEIGSDNLSYPIVMQLDGIKTD